MSQPSEPRWISLEVVRSIHLRQLAEHGGAEGIRDEGLLESALHRPLQAWHYDGSNMDLPALAASYAWGLVRNHPFVDGNKRVAYVICRLFLLLNGVDFEASREEKYDTFLALAEGRIDDRELASWLRERLRPLQP